MVAALGAVGRAPVLPHAGQPDVEDGKAVPPVPRRSRTNFDQICLKNCLKNGKNLWVQYSDHCLPVVQQQPWGSPVQLHPILGPGHLRPGHTLNLHYND